MTTSQIIHMSKAARDVLVAACKVKNVPATGWDHYLTSMSDEGSSVFVYDNDEGETLRVTLTNQGQSLNVELVPAA